MLCGMKCCIWFCNQLNNLKWCLIVVDFCIRLSRGLSLVIEMFDRKFMSGDLWMSIRCVCCLKFYVLVYMYLCFDIYFILQIVCEKDNLYC